MTFGSEQEITKRTRIIIVAVLWMLILVPLLALLFAMIGWWVLIGVAAAVWATVDYIKKGGTGDTVDRFKTGF
ncbi:MAG: hypothetical protein ACR2NL_06625 [Acidimicrobiia bacterium]